MLLVNSFLIKFEKRMIMKTPVTLNIEATLVEKIKLFAESKKEDLSTLVEDYFNSIIDFQKKKNMENKEETFSDKIHKMINLKEPFTLTDEEMDKMRYEYLTKKHGPANIS
jgi:hypothetical protein